MPPYVPLVFPRAAQLVSDHPSALRGNLSLQGAPTRRSRAPRCPQVVPGAPKYLQVPPFAPRCPLGPLCPRVLPNYCLTVHPAPRGNPLQDCGGILGSSGCPQVYPCAPLCPRVLPNYCAAIFQQCGEIHSNKMRGNPLHHCGGIHSSTARESTPALRENPLQHRGGNHSSTAGRGRGDPLQHCGTIHSSIARESTPALRGNPLHAWPDNRPGPPDNSSKMDGQTIVARWTTRQ